MRAVTLRGLLARRLRLTLTALAVAVGVMLVAGSYIFTDTINRSFDRIFAAGAVGTDAAITPNDDVEFEFGQPPPMRAAILDRVRRVPGVALAEGTIEDFTGTVLDKEGDRVNKGGGAPNFILSMPRARRFQGVDFQEGRAPRTADEVTLDKLTADRKGFRLGDRIEIQGRAPKKGYTIVGLTAVAGVDSFGGATVAALTLPEAQRVTGKRGRFDRIVVAGAPDVTPARLKASLRAALPRTVDVRTGTEQAAKESRDIREELGFLQTALLAFAGVALFVGAFIIFNTFSITVAQRMREFALLRTLGATRAQVLRAVLAEGLVLGVLGSAAGLGLGVVIASGLREMFEALGVDLPSSGTVILARTVIVSLLVGTLVTALSTLAPALRVTQVAPVAALREGAVLPRSRGHRFIAPLAALLGAGGLALLAIGLLASLSSSTALTLVGIGAATLFIGVALLSPRLVRPLASAVGRPLERAFGIMGRLARENTVRLPGRTAATAAALMIGVALVSFASIFAAGARETIRGAVDRGFRGEAVLQNTDGFSPISAEIAPAVARLPGVERVAAVRFANGEVAGDSEGVTGVDPATFTSLYHADWQRGDNRVIRRLRPRQVVVSKDYAEKHGTEVGEVVRVVTPAQRTVALRVTGIVDDRGHLLSSLTVVNASVRRDFGLDQHGIVLVGFARSASAVAVKARVDRELERRFPQAEALTAAEFKDKQVGDVNQLLGLIYALLSLSIIAALFGVVNTLVLSITERTRELGMLRAVGTSRRQVRRMIRYESVITTMIGGLLGLPLGIVLAVLVSQPLDDFVLAIPVANLALLMVLAGIAGVAAAVLPARRAAKLDVLAALAYE
jgi:putative ABC transport system permease protein